MTTFARVAIATAFLLTVLPPLAAQDLPLRPGQRIRVTSEGVEGHGRAGVVVGVLVGVGDETIVVRSENRFDAPVPLSIKRTAIESIDVSRERERLSGVPLAIGAVVGGGIGYAVGRQRTESKCRFEVVEPEVAMLSPFGYLLPTECEPEVVHRGWAGAALGAVSGTLLGLAFAVGARDQRWQEVWRGGGSGAYELDVAPGSDGSWHLSLSLASR